MSLWNFGAILAERFAVHSAATLAVAFASGCPMTLWSAAGIGAGPLCTRNGCENGFCMLIKNFGGEKHCKLLCLTMRICPFQQTHVPIGKFQIPMSWLQTLRRP